MISWGYINFFFRLFGFTALISFSFFTAGVAGVGAAFLITASGNPFAPAFYVMAAAAVSLVVVLRARETFRLPLRQQA